MMTSPVFEDEKCISKQYLFFFCILYVHKFTRNMHISGIGVTSHEPKLISVLWTLRHPNDSVSKVPYVTLAWVIMSRSIYN